MTRIVALGGTVNPGSSTEQALRLARPRPQVDVGEEEGADPRHAGTRQPGSPRNRFAYRSATRAMGMRIGRSAVLKSGSQAGAPQIQAPART